MSEAKPSGPAAMLVRFFEGRGSRRSPEWDDPVLGPILEQRTKRCLELRRSLGVAGAAREADTEAVKTILTQAFAQPVVLQVPPEEREALQHQWRAAMEDVGSGTFQVSALDVQEVATVLVAGAREAAAVRTLERLGYRWGGGVEWKPPRGPAPDFGEGASGNAGG